MNFDELETLWNSPQPGAGRQPAPAGLAHALAPELRRRSRFISYELFCLTLGLVLTSLLAIVNALYRAPENPVFYWLRAAVFGGVVALFLVGAIRRLRRHRELAAAQADSIAAFAAKALASVDAEMRDYRTGAQAAALWIALTLLSIQANLPVETHGWGPFAARAASALAFYAVVAAVCWRHYRKNLEPERARRERLLAQLS